MTASSCWVIKVMLQGTAGAFGLLGAVCAFMEVWQDQKHEGTRTWFRGKWVALNESPWLFLPERIIEWFLRLPRFPAIWKEPQSTKGEWFQVAAYWYYLAAMIISVTLLRHVGKPLVCVFLAAGALAFVSDGVGSRIRHGLWLVTRLVLWGAVHVAVLLVWTSYILSASLPIAVPTMVVMVIPLSIIVLFLCWSVAVMCHKGHVTASASQVPDWIGNLCWAIPTSFAVTLVAMLLGHLAEPGAPMPRTGWMLGSNVLFDTVTILVTLSLLAWSIMDRPLFRIPLAVLADLSIGGAFAFGSLYLGLVFTDKGLSVLEIARVLIARSPDGSKWELGPYFWTMHTTFIPILAYLSAVMLCWTGKAMLIPVRAFFGRGQEHSNPLKLAAGLCALVAAFFALASVPFGAAQDYWEKQEQLQREGQAACPAMCMPAGGRHVR